MSEEISLVVGKQKIYGWTDVRITRGVERLPSDFDIGMTERFPGSVQDVVVSPGDPCQVFIGPDLIITGYVDRFVPSIGPDSHAVRITGRGKCSDLVDCAAIYPNYQISNGSVLAIANKLGEPYGIKVTAIADVGGVIPQVNILHGESAFDVIERICRYRALLAYDLPDGNLVLAQVSSAKHSSGVTEGQNVEEAAAKYSMDERFSEYTVYLQSMETLNDAGSGSSLLATKKDPGVPRFRRKDLIAEAGSGGLDISIKRANWEAARRMGRSMQLQVKVDSWRDSAGALWTPNQLVPISLPTLKTADKEWLLGEVTFSRDASGTGAHLLLMPPDAFNPEPRLLQPDFADVPSFAPSTN